MQSISLSKKHVPDQRAQSFWQLRLQRIIAHALFPLTYLITVVIIRMIWRYRMPNLGEVRQKFKSIAAQIKGPLLVCPNHLTLIDSVIIMWALAPWWRYTLRFSLFSWNLPEKNNFYHRLLFRYILYIGKCMPIVRGGSKEKSKESFAKITMLLRQNDSVMIFPEGTRSRSGKVDGEDFSYACGTFLQAVPKAATLCIYCRGKEQIVYSDYPKNGDEFYCDLELITPSTTSKGLRGIRDLSTQVIQKLSEMETIYFEQTLSCRQ